MYKYVNNNNYSSIKKNIFILAMGFCLIHLVVNKILKTGEITLLYSMLYTIKMVSQHSAYTLRNILLYIYTC